MNDWSANPEYAAKMEELRKDLLALSADVNDPLDYESPVESWKKASPKKEPLRHDRSVTRHPDMN